MKRRDFLKGSLTLGSLLGLRSIILPTQLFASVGAQGSANNKVVFVFLRGGADVLSLFPPKINLNIASSQNPLEYGSHPLFDFRGLNANMCESFLFSSNKYKFGNSPKALEFPGHSVMFHPEFAPLSTAINSSNLAVVLHTGSKNESRSHFEQQDLIEFGSKDIKFNSGFLARASSAFNNRNPIAMGSALPKSLLGSEAVLLEDTSDLSLRRIFGAGRVNMGNLSGSAERLGKRLDLYVPNLNCESVLCRSANTAKEVYMKLENDLKNYQDISGSAFLEACSLAAELTKAESNPSIITIDFLGWDSHFKENPTIDSSGFSSNVRDLANGLNSLYSKMSPETVVVVASEFGRTVVANGSLGTDHGRGSATILMGKKIDNRKIYNNPEIKKNSATWDLSNFAGVNQSIALEVKVDVREILAEVIDKHMGIPMGTKVSLDPRIDTIFDRLSNYTTRNLIT